MYLITYITHTSDLLLQTSYCIHSDLASLDNERLILRLVFMDGHHSPWLHCIKHPMALISQRLMKVVIHPKSRRSLGLS